MSLFRRKPKAPEPPNAALVKRLRAWERQLYTHGVRGDMPGDLNDDLGTAADVIERLTALLAVAEEEQQ